MKDYHDLDKHDDSFEVGDLVAYFVGDRSSVNKKLRARFTGPWKIVLRIRDNTVRIKNLHDGKIIDTHVNMLKRYKEDAFIPLIELRKTERAKLTQQLKKSRKSQATKPRL